LGKQAVALSESHIFLGTTDEFFDIMTNICDEVEELGIGASHVRISEHTEVLNACARGFGSAGKIGRR
jgi:hypothetical protein